MTEWINSAPLPLVFLLLVVGFFFLIKGADAFVDGSSNIARKFHIPSIIIGLTIVAMGTSLPETAVSVTASLANNNELAISNAIGSNIFNLMVVIGVCGMLVRIPVEEDTIRTDIPLSAFCAILLLLMGMSKLGVQSTSAMTISQLDGFILLFVFALYILNMIRKAYAANRSGASAETEEEAVELHKISVPKSLGIMVLGAIGIAIGGDLTVDTASRIAVSLGMSQTLVGLTIVSVGTSLPELVTSIVAARKNELGMALGNAIGSNIFNALMVLGIASSISPLTMIRQNVIDIFILLIFTLIVWLFARTHRMIKRWEAMTMLSLYAVYAVYICLR